MPEDLLSKKKKDLIEKNKNKLKTKIENSNLSYLLRNYDYLYNIFIIDYCLNKEMTIDDEYLLLLFREYKEEKKVDTIKTELMNHQIKAINNILNYNKNIIVSTTGSGKTLMAIYYAEKLYNSSLIENIVFITERNTDIIGKELEKHLIFSARSKYNLTTYYNLDKIEIKKDTLYILDEIHKLKNISKRTISFLKLGSKYILGLTATLIERVTDMSVYKDLLSIENFYQVEYKLNVDYDYILCPIITAPHTKIIKTDYFSDLDILKKELYERKEKLHYLSNIIINNIDKKILINAFSLTNIDYIYKYVNLLFENCLTISGEDTNIKKNKTLSDFLSSKTKNVLISSSVLSSSYNLQDIDILIIYEQPFSYIYKKQLQGRIIRIGSKSEKKIYDFYYENTIEEKIFRLNNQKQIAYDELLNNDIDDFNYDKLSIEEYTH